MMQPRRGGNYDNTGHHYGKWSNSYQEPPHATLVTDSYQNGSYYASNSTPASAPPYETTLPPMNPMYHQNQHVYQANNSTNFPNHNYDQMYHEQTIGYALPPPIPCPEETYVPTQYNNTSQSTSPVYHTQYPVSYNPHGTPITTGQNQTQISNSTCYTHYPVVGNPHGTTVTTGPSYTQEPNFSCDNTYAHPSNTTHTPENTVVVQGTEVSHEIPNKNQQNIPNHSSQDNLGCCGPEMAVSCLYASLCLVMPSLFSFAGRN